jgi:thiamine biosynthesis lipoprotein
MGTDVTLRASGVGAATLDDARALVESLERRWTRFDPASELMRMNAAAGGMVVVSRETARLLALALDAYTWSAGRVDVTVGPGLRRLGYDRSFELVAAAPHVGVNDGLPPGCGGIEVDTDTNLVTLPAGVEIDVGGLAKGYAADLVVAELLERGASAVCADLGGDVRVSGTPPGRAAWIVAVDDPFRRGRDLARVALRDGAVATSTTLKRRWHDGTRAAHHLVDPATGQPLDNGNVAATAVGATAALAEIAAKVALMTPGSVVDEALARLGASALVVGRDGATVARNGMEDYLR